MKLLIIGFTTGIIAMMMFISILEETFNEASACYGRATGIFNEGGYRYAYKVVIDTAKTDSLNNWKKK